MPEGKIYDVAVVGGGLAGLSAAIGFSRNGHSVVLFEKEQYPFHKVCGEYISNESLGFLESLGIRPGELHWPSIDEFLLTSPNGNLFRTRLPLGGFGVSRFTLDHLLSTLAISAGVHVRQETKVESVRYEEGFIIDIHAKGKGERIYSKLCIGSFGKRSNLDIKWKRNIPDQKDKRLQNYIGVKYHIKTNWPANLIGLHNFENGYCGISKIEDDKYCLCYLVHANNLKLSGNSIPQMEKNYLYRNPHLEKIFLGSEFETEFPVTISQVSFKKKSRIGHHILMAGDAGGMITPLCGNGMSIAMHSGKIAAILGHDFLTGELTREAMELKYVEECEKNFGSRLRKGRILQRFFGSPALSNGFVNFFRLFPFLAAPVIRQTHGKSF